MSTIHTRLDVITRNRKRPKKGDAITKRTWDEAFEKELENPSFIDWLPLCLSQAETETDFGFSFTRHHVVVCF
jgi:hypothetical protein